MSVVVSLTMPPYGTKRELTFTAAAYGRQGESAGLAYLTSTQLTPTTANLQTMAAVITHLLYMLDGQLARLEMEESKPAV